MLSLFLAGRIKNVLSDLTERVLETCTWLPLDLIPYTFSFADVALCPVSVINYSCEYDCAEPFEFF